MRVFLLLLVSVLIICLGIVFFPRKTTVSSGEIGVVVNRLKRNGIDTTYILLPGNNWIFNYQKIIQCSTDTRSLNIKTEVKSANNEIATISCELKYNLNVNKIPSLYKFFGADYEQTFFIPAIIKLTRHSLNGVSMHESQDSIQSLIKQSIDSSEVSDFMITYTLLLDKSGTSN
jgi:hypothetical protein